MVKDIVPMAFDFIEKHILDIILVVLLLFCMVIYIVLNNIKFPKSHPKLQRVVVLENLDNIDPDKEDSDTISAIESEVEKKAEKKVDAAQPKTTKQNINLCSGGLQDKNRSCIALKTKDSCGSADCCIWAKKKKSKNFSCIGGDEGGATYDGHDYDAHYYKNKRFDASKGD
jgi:hypothetical protein